MGLEEIAGRLERAVTATFAAGIRTPDVGGSAGTKAFARAIAERLE